MMYCIKFWKDRQKSVVENSLCSKYVLDSKLIDTLKRIVDSGGEIVLVAKDYIMEDIK